MKILVVDHEKVKRANLADKLAAHGHQLQTAKDGEQAVACMQRERFDLVFADRHIPCIDGIELLRRIKAGLQPDAHVVMISSNGAIPDAVNAVKLGAYDFLRKPIRAEKLMKLLNEIQQQRSSESSAPESPSSRLDVDQQIIGCSAEIARVKRMVRIAAKTDANVLIHGETGVGKDLIASVIHGQSHRRSRPYTKVGCTLLAPALIESELYGHEEGAFTGAERHRPGRFELAEGGTIYLDDVDDIPLEQQAKLLRVIEEKVFERVGGSEPIRANVRIIASTKVDLLDRVSAGTFRQDLYYRLDVLRLRVPSLKNRPADIPALTDHLLGRIAPGEHAEIGPEAIDVLSGHRWPGNVRELYHVLERAWLVGDGVISADFLRVDLQADESPDTPADVTELRTGFKDAMNYAEKQLLVNALDVSGGNKTAAAHALGMKPSTFRDKLAKHGLR